MYELPISGFTENVTVSATVAKSGYIVDGNPQAVEVYYFSGADEGSLTINFDPPAGDIDAIAYHKDNNSLNFSIADAGSYSDFRWILDGIELSETTAGITLDAGGLSAGPHRLTVIASQAGVAYSQEITFRIN